MDTYPEPLERIFQKVEEETERRAQALNELESSSASKSRARRTGSISISRFGQLADDLSKIPDATPASGTVTPIAAQSAFYRTHLANASTDSLSSNASTATAQRHDLEDEHHVTRMHHIAGRPSFTKAVGNLLPRRLSRARSSHVISPTDGRVLIGVSVQEATVEAAEEETQGAVQGATVHAPAALKSQPSRMTMAESSPAGSGWIKKAKVFSQKLRRKGKRVTDAEDEA